MQNKIFLILIGFLLFIEFSGCATIQKEHVTKTYYDLDVQMPVPLKNTDQKASTLLVKELLMSPSFDSHTFIYKIS